eukprot:scaffold5021_cov123-Isochrysis_galbana.AAC.3
MGRSGGRRRASRPGSPWCRRCSVATSPRPRTAWTGPLGTRRGGRPRPLAGSASSATWWPARATTWRAPRWTRSRRDQAPGRTRSHRAGRPSSAEPGRSPPQTGLCSALGCQPAPRRGRAAKRAPHRGPA